MRPDACLLLGWRRGCPALSRWIGILHGMSDPHLRSHAGPAVEVLDVAHSYGDRTALDGVSLRLETGTTALIGVNGSGKSTLLSILAGALEPGTGSVRVMGLDPYRSRQRRAALPHIALMPQQAAFPSNMTIREVVGFIGWARGLGRNRARSRADVVIEQVGLSARADEQLKRLSGGMVRRVALAQALVSEPAVLLLDEPSTGLDPEQRRGMVSLIRELGSTVLFSSHVVEDVKDVAQRVLVLEEGRLLFSGTVGELEALAAPTGDASARAGSDIEAGLMKLLADERGRHG